jgi:hypothetical protein
MKLVKYDAMCRAIDAAYQAVPQRDFEAALADHTTMPTTAGITAPKVRPVADDALKAWGEKRGFRLAA